MDNNSPPDSFAISLTTGVNNHKLANIMRIGKLFENGANVSNKVLTDSVSFNLNCLVLFNFKTALDNIVSAVSLGGVDACPPFE